MIFLKLNLILLRVIEKSVLYKITLKYIYGPTNPQLEQVYFFPRTLASLLLEISASHIGHLNVMWAGSLINFWLLSNLTCIRIENKFVL